MTSLDKHIKSNNIIRYYKSPLKTVKETDEYFSTKNLTSKKNTKNGKTFINIAKINLTNNGSFNSSVNKTTNINTNNTAFKLPILDVKNMSKYSKMKQYKVLLPKHRDKKEISIEEQEEKVRKFLDKYAKTNYKQNKYLIDDNITKKYDFDSYLKLQSAAELKFKPRFGDKSNLLISYIKKVSTIRKKIVDDFLDEIDKNSENRYNLEKPKVDFNFRSKDKYLLDNRWKNTFSLDEYQTYFTQNLKGKISGNSYLNMVKRFKKISLICFSEGNLNRNEIKRLDNVD